MTRKGLFMALGALTLTTSGLLGVTGLLGVMGVVFGEPDSRPSVAHPPPSSMVVARETAGLNPLPFLAKAPQEVEEGPPYNGQFTFVRLRFGSGGSDMRSFGFGRRGGRGRGAPWSHDYPRAETNFAKIVEATTYIDTYTEGNSGRVLALDDPELFNYPIASIIEVGYWNPTQEEVVGLRNYLLKGGFLIVDDTRQDRGYEFQNFREQMSRVLPGYEILVMPPEHEIYDSFFRIDDPQSLVPPYGRQIPVYMGVFEDNDPLNGRIMVMINFNTDLQEYWEFSDRGYYPIDLSNEAYKFGINYLIYAYTH